MGRFQVGSKAGLREQGSTKPFVEKRLLSREGTQRGGEFLKT